ncbi:hypothetical protein [Kouleothrix sp.]|uniref:hypothetical protein n=1 Tax=Kouleothrix sp. TaxID=2779161 RepID=UPI00391C07AD
MLDISRLEKLITLHNTRLFELKKRLAIQGIESDPAIRIEITEIEEKILQLNYAISSLNSDKNSSSLKGLSIEDIIKISEVVSKNLARDKINKWSDEYTQIEHKRQNHRIITVFTTLYFTFLISSFLSAIFFLFTGEGIKDKFMLMISTFFTAYLLSTLRSVIDMSKTNIIDRDLFIDTSIIEPINYD